jgi:hypothetical protein
MSSIHDLETCGIDPVSPVCPGCRTEKLSRSDFGQDPWHDEEQVRQCGCILDILADLIRDHMPEDAPLGLRWLRDNRRRMREALRGALAYELAEDIMEISGAVR